MQWTKALKCFWCSVTYSFVCRAPCAAHYVCAYMHYRSPSPIDFDKVNDVLLLLPLLVESMKVTAGIKWK